MLDNPTTSLQETCTDTLDACLCFNLRRLTREVRLRYDAMLQPIGITSSQVILLLAVGEAKCTTMHKLAERLGSDRTVLSRTLRPLEAEQLIRVEAGADRRTREISLTEKGENKVEQAQPYWVQAQEDITQQIGKQLFAELSSALTTTYNAL